MNTLSKHLLLFALLLVAGLTASAQGTGPTITERLALTLVDYQSQYSAVTELNTYTNTLRLAQPTGNDKFFVDLLREGNNYIVFHRTDDQGADDQFARINLPARAVSVTSQSLEELSSVNFASGGTLNSNGWSGTVSVSYNYAYITGDNSVTYTIPTGISDVEITVAIQTANTDDGGRYAFNINGQILPAVKNTLIQCQLDGTYSAGDVITITGCNTDGSAHYSPDMVPSGKAIIIKYRQTSNAIAIEAPYIQNKSGDGWGMATLIGGTQTYAQGDTVNLFGLGEIVDSFTASTALNEHPEYYDYHVSYFYGNEPDDPNAPLITANPTELTIDGQNGYTGTFTVSGTNLIGDIVVTGDANFTVSPSTISAADAMQGNVTVTVTASSAIRFKTNGTITLSSPGAQPVTVNINYIPPIYLISAWDFSSNTNTGYLNGTAPWSNTSNGVQGGRGYAYVRQGSNQRKYYIYVTIPEGYTNENLILAIVPTDDSSGNGYIRFNGSNSNIFQLTQGEQLNILLSNVSAGDQFYFDGCTSNGGYAASPHIVYLGLLYYGRE